MLFTHQDLTYLLTYYVLSEERPLSSDPKFRTEMGMIYSLDLFNKLERP